MKRFSTILSLDRVGAQMTILVIVSLIVIHAVISAIFIFGHDETASHHARLALTPLTSLLVAAPESDRPKLVEAINRAFPELDLRLGAAGTVPANAVPPLGPPGVRPMSNSPARSVLEPRHTKRLTFALPNGAVTANVATSGPPIFGSPWMLTLLFGIVSVTLLLLWATRALGRPLSRLAGAVETFDIDRGAPTLPEYGPHEVRAVAHAFNRMSERITQLVEDRTRMLAAIGHDLRTPITRMRLRADFIEDSDQRAAMISDLHQMTSMVESVLAFLRHGRDTRPKVAVDLVSIARTVCDQFADMGHDVTFEGPDHLALQGQPEDLGRAIANLIDNAVKFGSRADVRLIADNERARIEVSDNGPGIADDIKARLTLPFVRGDEARNLNAAHGFGLGLAIARAVAENHGGDLSLADRQPHGLVARIALPITDLGRAVTPQAA
jgi:signal transduction histidine kinase